jgi:hypothetical protein
MVGVHVRSRLSPPGSCDLPFVELVREVAGRELREAGSWRDMEKRLARQGLRIQARGQGMAVTDGREFVKWTR